MTEDSTGEDVDQFTIPSRQTVDIDLSRLEKIAHTGVRRAVIFMGLGLNAAHSEDFNDYELSKIPTLPGQFSFPIEFFPSDLPLEKVKEFKEEFAIWISGCGLRELLQYFALFLDHMHQNALLVLHSKGKLGNLDPQVEQTRFNRNLGIPDKLDTLNKRFSMSIPDADSIKQLYQARNCLEHDLGIVTPKRCGSDNLLKLSWKAFDLLARGDKSGIERPATELIGKITDEETSIILKNVIRERQYHLGTKLVLTQQDLWEICYFFKAYVIPSAIKSIVELFEEHGIPMKERPSPKP
ncbi:MAG: hypothetical protein HQ513_00365 [Rhodospirillales bacterium]|nr:hypothetical protein [Rhodospirillales bacterium]